MKRKIIRIICILIVCSCIIFGFSYGIFSIFKIKEITLVGSAMQLEINSRLLSSNLLFFPVSSVKRELLTAYPQFSDIKVTKKIPGTIFIEPILRTPKAVIQMEKSNFFVDCDGIIISPVESALGFPVIIVSDIGIRLGGKLKDEKTLKAISFVCQTESFLTVQQVSFENISLIRAKTIQTDIFISQNTDIATVVPTLQALISGFRIKATMPKSIDLRFTKPIVLW